MASILTLAALFMLAAAVFKPASFKGWTGEQAARFAAWLLLDQNTYHRLHNVTLMTDHGTTQVDHIYVSRYGVFVVETKNYAGWIYGREHDATWTQHLYRVRHSFQNPLRQNYRHTKAVQNLLGIDDSAVHSVVAFMGPCVLKTPLPPNVSKGAGFVRYIRSRTTPIFTESEVTQIVATLRSGRLPDTAAVRRKHVADQKARMTAGTEKACPRCGSTMKLRTARRGLSAGGQFYGCSDYPRCRAVEPAATRP